jgi:hypothetical protein
MASDTVPAVTSESAYHDLRHLIPSLAQELDSLRTALREHNLWLQRYSHSSSFNSTDPIPSVSRPTMNTDPDLPAYSGVDVPPYTTSLNEPLVRSARDEVEDRRNQITEWLSEGEDVLREYSARFAQLAEELGMPFEDVLGTWTESNPDNTLPDYKRIEEREEMMVGGVGEVPPPYTGGSTAG